MSSQWLVMPISPTQLSLREMRERGYRCQVVEFFHYYAKKRIDLFQIIDILCIRSGETVGVQTTAASCHAAHRTKILGSETVRPWLDAGNRLLLQSWRKKENRWVMREEEFRLDEIDDLL